MKTHDALTRPRAHQRNLVRRPAFGEMTVLVIFLSKSLCNLPSCQIPKLVLLYNCPEGEAKPRNDTDGSRKAFP